jgi:hypothetical protein
MRLLTLKEKSFLNFSSWCIKNMGVVWTEKDKIVKQHFVENKTEIMQHVLEM